MYPLENFLLILIAQAFSQEIKYKIAIPGTVCVNRNSKYDKVAIRLLGEDAKKLTYKWKINFKQIGSGCENFQRCTLMAWKSVRELEKYLQDNSGAAKDAGIININKTMLMPGVEYHFNVSVMSGDDVLEEKQYKLGFVDESDQQLKPKSLGSITLLGSDATYADLPYVINAEVTLCLRESDYYLSWDIIDSSENAVKTIPFKSPAIEIPPHTFRANNKYGIRCKMLDAKNHDLIDTGTHWIYVNKRGLQLNLPFQNLTVGLGQPVTINAFVKDPDNTDGELKIKWDVLNSKNESHPDIPSRNSTVLELDSGLYETGIYTVIVEVSKGDDVKSDTCYLTVIEENVPLVEFDKMESTVSTNDEIEIHTSVRQLMSGCTLQWSSVKIEGFESVELQSVPGNVDRVTKVEQKEDTLLNELEELNNGTLEEKYDLKIVPRQGSWKGLNGNTNYMFRLNITCPVTSFDDVEGRSVNDSTTLVTERPLYSFADVKISTKTPPRLKPLKVTPEQGWALQTTFIFATEKPDEDMLSVYKFGYASKNVSTVFASISYLADTETILPYSVYGMQSFLEGCNSEGACNKIFGPTIATKLPAFLDKNPLLDEFSQLMIREDYTKFYNLASMVVGTMEETRDENLTTEMKSFIATTTENEIKKWIGHANADDSKAVILNLIENVRAFADQHPLPGDVMNNVLQLESQHVMKDEGKLTYRKRKLLATKSLNDVLEFSEQAQEKTGVGENLWNEIAMLLEKSTRIKSSPLDTTRKKNNSTTQVPNQKRLSFDKTSQLIALSALGIALIFAVRTLIRKRNIKTSTPDSPARSKCEDFFF